MPRGTASARSHLCIMRAGFSLQLSLAEPCAHLHVFDTAGFGASRSSAWSFR